MPKKADLTPQWTPDNRVALRAFLGENPNFLRTLAMDRPKREQNEPADVHGHRIGQHFKTIEQIEGMASDVPETLSDMENS